MRRVIGGLLACAVLAMLLTASPAHADDKDKDKKDLALDKIPKKVMDALKAKFPKAKIVKWTKEKDGDVEVYDIEMTVEGKKTEADIKEDGTIVNFEVEVAIKDLPKAVTAAIEKKYPKSKLKEALKITDVKDKKEVSGGYEVILETSDKKEVEVTVSDEGKILEDSGEEKKDEKKDKDKKDK